jgi:MFS transporter, FSR family, fosmidomycin resistance protein
MAGVEKWSAERISPERRTLGAASAAHALHDGLTDALYVLLPVWAQQFGLGYAEVGFLRAVYTGTLASLQMPVSRLSRRLGAPGLLALGTALAGAGYLVAGASTGLVMLTVGLFIGGLGGSAQHPVASTLVATAYRGPGLRAAIGIYNFAGDIGKMLVPILAALLIASLTWRPAVALLGVAALLAAGAFLLALPRPEPEAEAAATEQPAATAAAEKPLRLRWPFRVMLATSAIDSSARTAFLTFLPFLLAAKGADLPTVGLAVALVFVGGAAGKLALGFLAARLGSIRTILATEILSALGVALLPVLPLWGCLALLPVLGIALNGTSSVFAGSIPDLVREQDRAHAFGVFYTATIGAAAVSPILFGLFSDAAGVPAMMLLVAAYILLTVPLALALRAHIRD